MLPIFNEYIQFLKDHNIDLDLQEGYCWLDRQIIKAYDTKGKLQKIARLHIDDNLNISYSKYKKKISGIESWQDTIKRNESHLINRQVEAIDVIQKTYMKYSDHEPIVLISGGKDSSTTDDIVQNYLFKSQRIFSNTSLGCADEYKYINSLENTKIIKPDMGFYKWIYDNIIPTRFSRGCCTYFKEGSMIDKLDSNKKYLFFMGMRNQESKDRSEYGDEWKNEKWGKRNWIACLPIREWSEEDVWLYILWKGLNFSPKYRKGYARVGCAIACPFYTKSTWVLDKYWYPKMYKRWHDILEKDFIQNYKWTRLNCTLEEYHTCWNGGQLRPEPTLEVVHEFAYYKCISPKEAEKYFNHTCKECGKKVIKKDEIAMNLKMLGRNIEEYFCKKHLMKYLGINKEQWKNYISDFKQQGCNLF